MTESKKKWETNELSVATFMAVMLDVTPEIEWDDAHVECRFLFEESEALLDHFADFIDGKALVEPRKFYMASGRIKKAMFGPRNRR